MNFTKRRPRYCFASSHSRKICWKSSDAFETTSSEGNEGQSLVISILNMAEKVHWLPAGHLRDLGDTLPSSAESALSTGEPQSDPDSSLVLWSSVIRHEPKHDKTVSAWRRLRDSIDQHPCSSCSRQIVWDLKV